VGGVSGDCLDGFFFLFLLFNLGVGFRWADTTDGISIEGRAGVGDSVDVGVGIAVGVVTGVIPAFELSSVGMESDAENSS